MSKLRLTLIVHLLFFAGWAGYLLFSHRSADAIWLETIPVDPRDLISGNYVALSFDTASKIPSCSTDRPSGTPVYVLYKKMDIVTKTEQGPIQLWTPTDCRYEMPKTEDEVWVEGRVENRRILYGIERFYVSEGNDLRWARSGDVVAKVAINGKRQARILELVKRSP